VYDFHPVIRKYLQGKSSGGLTFTPYELHRYITYYSDFIRNLYENFGDDVSKHAKLVDLLTADRINDFYQMISGISDERKKSVISNLLGLLLLQTGHKTRALFYHELCYDIDSRLGELDRVANDLNNIGACFSEQAFSDEALSIHIKLAIEYENENRYKDSAKQYIGSGLIYARKGDYENAERSFKNALSNFRKGNGSDRDIAGTLMNLSIVLMYREKYQDAIDSCIDIVPFYAKLGDHLSVASVHSNLSIIYRKRGAPTDLDAALDSIKKARDIDFGEKNTRGLIRDYRVMAKVYRKMNDEINASKCDASANAAIIDFERETHEPFTDTGYYDFLEYFD
jgi:tetratricopeptide (TPR) repeat protein